MATPYSYTLYEYEYEHEYVLPAQRLPNNTKS